MAHAQHHAESSARRYGGVPEDFIRLHEWMDASKIAFAGRQHRAIRHHAFGVFEAEEVFGRTLTVAGGRQVPVRMVAEQHIREDLGCVPSVQDWVAGIPLKPWMLGGSIEQGDPDDEPDRSVERWRADVAAGRTILSWIEWAHDGGAALVRPFLDVSTGHLSPATRAMLDETPLEALPGTALRGAYGWIIHAGFAAWPEDVAAAIALAHAQCCDYVMFDRDGMQHPDLPWFEDAA